MDMALNINMSLDPLQTMVLGQLHRKGYIDNLGFLEILDMIFLKILHYLFMAD